MGGEGGNDLLYLLLPCSYPLEMMCHFLLICVGVVKILWLCVLSQAIPALVDLQHGKSKVVWISLRKI